MGVVVYKLFKSADSGGDVSAEQVELSWALRHKLSLLSQGIEGRIGAYQRDVKDPLAAIKGEIDSIYEITDTDPKQAFYKILSLLGLAPQQEDQPNQQTPASVPPQESLKTPPTPTNEEKGQASVLQKEVGNIESELSNILPQNAGVEEANGGDVMPNSAMAIQDIIKLALSKNADPQMGAMMPTDAEQGVASGPPKDQPTSIKLHGVSTIVGDMSIESKEKRSLSATGAGENYSILSGAYDALMVAKVLEESPYDPRGKEERVDALKKAADNVISDSMSLDRALDQVVSALRDLCSAAETNDLFMSTKNLQDQAKSLESYLDEEWPHDDQLDASTGPENLEDK